ncbi:MAG TPA: hypothetical protein ENN13_01730 [Candidatus Altiarchaeales archaeon]|nr:hypothetical protein [Candidatus Altiarchaeales archaeon]
MERIEATAFPGLPVVFAEGYRSVEDRTSLHSHASFALTSIDEEIRTETSIQQSVSDSFTLDGKTLIDSRSGGIFRLIDEMKSLAGYGGGLEITSENRGILSGSSDSGAAALALALNDFLEAGLDRKSLCQKARLASETAYRSVLGGLSIYEISGGNVSEYQLMSEKELRDLACFAIPFDTQRQKADVIHQAVVKHPKYLENAKIAEENLVQLKNCVDDKDLEGILSIMESDAKRAHKMFGEVGCNVITPMMREACVRVEKAREDGLNVFWNVAGASVVYVFSLNDYGEEVFKLVAGFNMKHVQMKVASPALSKSFLK